MSSPKQGILAPGVVLNFTYEIVELIGVGGTGEVYVANNQATGRQVAIKLLKREFATDPTLVELMQREAHALHEIMHNAVVRYYELLRTDHEGGFSFLVMEYIEGESLSDRIGRGPLPINEVQSIARRIVDGLEAAHRHKVLHRDLTPANIILRKNDPALATMIDFGIAKDQTQTKHSVIGSGFAGTYQYASPEQIDGRQIDARSDFYSLGATLLAACEGKGAGDGKTLEQIIGSKAAVPDLEHIPGEMRPLIQALLQPNPDDRPKTTDEIRVLMDGLGAVDDLDELLGGGAAADERTVIRPAAASNSGTSKDTSKISAPASEKKGSGAVGWVAILLVLVAMGVGAFFIVPDLLEEPLPVASPYEMNLTVAGGTAALRGNAPSEEAVETLRNKIDEALEVGTLNGRLTAAEGAPSANWGDAMVKLIAAAKPLGDFVLTAADTRVALRGMADTPQIYDNVKKTTQEIAAIEALALEFQVALAPQPLAHAAVNAAAAAFSKCGLLSVTGPDPLPPGIPLRLSGPIATESDEDNLRKAMIDLDPNRNVQLDVTVTSELVCKFERLMPGANAPEMGFLFSYGQKGGRLTAADYIAGENPVIDVSIDKSYKDSFLYVFYVDGNTSKVIHLLPYKDRPENVVARAGDESENDYRVRILYPASDVAVGKRGFLVGPPYGTNILVAVASPTAFLEAMLPRNDAAELFLDDLIDALKRAATSDFIVAREFFTTREE